ncbi:MAG: hypothetical protein N4A65_16360 [Cohaesibacter sp.]|jgi:hypothetical protein|nr:hypothetical protein [Cohaesibacter sp.]
MRKNLALALMPFLLVSSATLLGAGSAAADSLRYENGRYGTQVLLPMQIRGIASPQNGDGYIFGFEGWEGHISVYAAQNFRDNGIAGYRRQMQKNFDDITYEAGKKDWFVLSGRYEHNIYYLRVKGCEAGPMHHIYFEHPAKEKEFWKSIIEDYAKTLDGPCFEPD